MTSFRATKKSNIESYLDIDLEELFGGPVPDSSSFRQSVGQEVLDIIVERTKDADYLNNAKSSYSSAYADTLEFAAFGKSRGNVNLTQSGDMLGLLDIIEESSNSIKIGWSDDDNKAKGTNHNFGVTVPRREFLGLTSKEADIIKEKFQDELQATQSENSFQSSVDNLRAFIVGETSINSSQTTDGIFRALFAGLDDDES